MDISKLQKEPGKHRLFYEVTEVGEDIREWTVAIYQCGGARALKNAIVGDMHKRVEIKEFYFDIIRCWLRDHPQDIMRLIS